MLLRHLALALAARLAGGAVAAAIPGPRVAGANRRAVPTSHVLHEQAMPQWEQSWEQKQKVPLDAVLPMRIGLRQSNRREGHDMLMDM